MQQNAAFLPVVVQSWCHFSLWLLQVRVLALAAALAIAARGSGYLPARAAAFAHLLSWAILVGTNLWTTFFAGITMFKNLPRQVFGKLQVRQIHSRHISSSSASDRVPMFTGQCCCCVGADIVNLLLSVRMPASSRVNSRAVLTWCRASYSPSTSCCKLPALRSRWRRCTTAAPAF